MSFDSVAESPSNDDKDGESARRHVSVTFEEHETAVSTEGLRTKRPTKSGSRNEEGGFGKVHFAPFSSIWS
jgi:hypothetical protein